MSASTTDGDEIYDNEFDDAELDNLGPIDLGVEADIGLWGNRNTTDTTTATQEAVQQHFYSEFPSELLYSEFPGPSSQVQQQQQQQHLQPPPPSSPPPPSHTGFSDALEAQTLLQQEQKEKWDQEGRVIRGNIFGRRDAERSVKEVLCGDNSRRKRRRGIGEAEGIRSSSLPPETPTPVVFDDDDEEGVEGLEDIEEEVEDENENGEAEEEEEEDLETTPRPRKSTWGSGIKSGKMVDSMDVDMDMGGAPQSTMLEYPSSPPSQVKTPPRKAQQQKKANPFSYGDSDSDSDAARSDKATKTTTIPKKPVAQSVDDFFSGGRSSEKLVDLPSRAAASKRPGPFQEIDEDEEEEMMRIEMEIEAERHRSRRELTPPPVAPSLDEVDLFAEMMGRPAQRPKPSTTNSGPSRKYGGEDISIDIDGPIGDAPMYYSTPGLNTVPVLLMSGKTLHVRRKPVKIPSISRTFGSEAGVYDENGDRETKKSYYGVDIHNLLDSLQHEKKLEEYAQLKKQHDIENNVPIPEPVQRADRSQKDRLLWTEKYRAKRFTDLLGDERTHRQVLRWLKAWDDIVFPGSSNKLKKGNNRGEDEGYVHKRVLLITGPPGLGKTTLAHVAARQAGYEPLEINASDDRTAAVVKGRIRDALSNEGVRIPGLGATGGKKKSKGVGTGRPVCVIVDEIDGVTGGGGGGEGGFMSALVDLIMQDQKNCANAGIGSSTMRRRKKKPGDNFKFHRPLIAICNDLYAPALRALRPLAEVIYMRKPPANLIVSRLKWVFDQEGVPAEDTAIRRLVELTSSGSAAQSAYGGGGGGDMRGCLVGGEWLAKRLQASLNLNGTCTKLTRKLVEDEMDGGGGSGGGGGRDTSSNSRGGVRGCVERIFRKGTLSANTRKPPGGGGRPKLSTVDARRKEWDMLREEVECCGEFDKIMSDVFASYISRPYHDDVYLTKPCMAYDWLFFHDLLSARVFLEQDYELMGYLGIPALAFNTLFASSDVEINQGAFLNSNSNANASVPGDEEKEPPPFTGPRADWEHREGLKAVKAVVQALHQNLFSGTPPIAGTPLPTHNNTYDPPPQASPDAIRFATAFKNIDTVVTELAPYLTRILSPKVNPVLVGGASTASTSGGATQVQMVASVRKESERKLVTRAVEVMYHVGIGFEKVRLENTFGASGTSGFGGWAYRMEPGIDSLTSFTTWNTPTTTTAPAAAAAAVGTTLSGSPAAAAPGPTTEPVRYAVRQVMVQDLAKYMLQQKIAAREQRVAKMGGVNPSASSSSSSSSSANLKSGKTAAAAPVIPGSGTALKRDFFGRAVADDVMGGGETKRRRKDDLAVGGGGAGGGAGDGSAVVHVGKVWVTFNEGFSNAVKKGVTLEEFMGGLY
ncbi:hypothetical protein DFH27DRAFT_578609 [Peziza echinospora]|nr:hypothetical protein DFH27DRAFT_578609 [Peziza echinospora]